MMTMKDCRELVKQSGSFESTATVLIWKRLLDTSCILIAIPVLLPLFISISIAIFTVSRGPVLFRQQRIGHKGRRFTCLKFRTMRVNSAIGVHQNHLSQLILSKRPMTKLDVAGDSRLIPLGSFLRSTGLDELPQLFNILRGEMTLVGPRPCLSYEFEHYLPWHKERLQALPGLTGLWQVSGKNKTTFDEMVNLDIFYARNASIWLDLKILLRTIPAVAQQAWEQNNQRKKAKG